MSEPEIYLSTDRVAIIHGDCLDVLRDIPDASIDSIVTDPPYGLGFMGKAWDDLPPGLPWALECLRVLKPGGHMLAFGGTRTWHRLACAVEDAGFEMRDSIAWLYGSGFPKSLDVSKAIDKAAGTERAVVGIHHRHGGGSASSGSMSGDLGTVAELPLTAPATDGAREWSGWGTALKPAFEPIVVARKPLIGTVTANVLTHGTGALNIDACRVAGEAVQSQPAHRTGAFTTPLASEGERPREYSTQGRWPANVVLDESQAEALDQQSGVLTSGALKPYTATPGERVLRHGLDAKDRSKAYTSAIDTGGASRFFYCAKAPAKERPKVDGVAHPTVKPLTLMRWLVRLVTPPGGLVLEPFAGSGATIEAALLEGFNVVAIEREAEYLPLIDVRIERVSA